MWAVVSIGRLPPMDGPPPSREGVGLLTVLAVIAVGLYALAAWRAVQLYRLRGGNVLLSLTVAMILLAEAMVAVVVSRNWRLSWWEWHVLMLAAFVAIALGARSEYRRSGTLAGAFGGLYLEATLARLDRWHAGAIAAVAAAEEGGRSSDQVLAGLRREGATDADIALLEEAARELRRLDDAFRPYLPSVVAEGIRAGGVGVDRLGGEERVVSVLFADLAGFTTFSETRSPTEVLAMLNEQWAVVVPGHRRRGRRHRAFRRRRRHGHLQRRRVAARSRPAGGPRGGRRRRPPDGPSWRATRAGRSSGSASTRVRPSSARWARRSGAASRSSATRRTPPPG